MKHPYRYHPLFSALIAAGLCGISVTAFAAGVTAPTTSSSNISAEREVSSTTGSLDTLAHLPTKKQAFNSTHHSVISVGRVSDNATTQSVYSMHTDQLPSKKQIFNSGISVKVLGKKEIEAAGPAAGGAQMLNFAPGVNTLASYGGGAAKVQISIDGIKQGWGNPSGTEAAHSIAISFDGIPMNNPATGLWQSPQINQPSIIQGIHITYGPGNPENRWYNNIGGGINFVPIQPTQKPGANIGISYGSYNFKNIHFDIRTGNINGFSAVLAGGVSSGNSFLGIPSGTTLYSPSGVVLPSHSYAWYLKVRKHFHSGDDSFGAYLAKGSAYKPYYIPLYAADGTTIN